MPRHREQTHLFSCVLFRQKIFPNGRNEYLHNKEEFKPLTSEVFDRSLWVSESHQ
jgi:hypothetical protein